MSEERQELHKTIDRLHRQIGELEHVDPDVRHELESALDDILEVLAKPEESSHTSQSLSDRLSDASQHFQESHPALANTIGAIMHGLARMGI